MNINNLVDIQKRMKKCVARTGYTIPSLAQQKEDLVAWQQIREPLWEAQGKLRPDQKEELEIWQKTRKLLWDAQEGITSQHAEKVVQATRFYLDRCIGKGIKADQADELMQMVRFYIDGCVEKGRSL